MSRTVVSAHRAARRCVCGNRSIPIPISLALRDRHPDVSPECYARVGMDAAIWTAIGLLAATSLGSLFCLGSRIDGLGGRIDGLSNRIDALGGRLDTRLDAIESRIDAHLERHAAG